MKEKEKKTGKPLITGIKTDDAIPNNVHLQGFNYGVEMGSFSVGVREMTRIALRAIKRMKDIEEGKR